MNGLLTIRDIAGFCPETAVWKMLIDVSGILIKEDQGYQISADTIVVDGDAFFVTGEKNNSNMLDMVWELGAIAYYTATGHIVFGGHGGEYQQAHPHVTLPMLPKSFMTLTPIIHRCLCYDKSCRINMEDLSRMAEEGLTACLHRKREKSQKTDKPYEKNSKQLEKWPEEMKER